MTNLAQDARNKAQVRWPGAIVHSRGRSTIRHQHPTTPERFILDAHIGPIHYGPGEDQEIDTAWQPTTGAWQYEMTANGFQTYARNLFNAGDIFEFQKDGQSLRFDPQSINWVDENNSRQQIAIKQPVFAVVDDNILRFPDAYGPGRHFQYQNQSSKLQKLITIDQATDLPLPTVQGNEVWLEIEFSMSISSGIRFWINDSLWIPTNNVRVQTADHIEIRDVTGTEILWYLSPARAWDSSLADDGGVLGQLEVRRQGGPSSLFATVRIPKSWVDAAVFPIYIDPTIDDQVAASADDGYAYTATNFLTTSVAVRIGRSASHDYDCYFRYPSISGLSGATIDTAYVSVWPPGPDSNTLLTKFRAEDASAPTQVTSITDYYSRTLTTAGVDWDPGTWSSAVWYDSPSIISVIQELADSYDPSVISIFWMDDGCADSVYRRINTYDKGNSTAMKLHIEYTAGGATYPMPEALQSYRQRRI